jgi:hypothetical protein
VVDPEVIGPDERGDADAGFFFRPPPRFAVARQGRRFALSSDEDPGVLLVVPHDAPDADTLAAQLIEGWVEEGVELRPASELTREPGGGLRVELSGTLHGTPSRAVARAAFAPHGGGALVMALAAQEHWEPRRYDAYALMLVRSLRWAGQPLSDAGRAVSKRPPDWPLPGGLGA